MAELHIADLYVNRCTRRNASGAKEWAGGDATGMASPFGAGRCASAFGGEVRLVTGGGQGSGGAAAQRRTSRERCAQPTQVAAKICLVCAC